MDLLIVESPTKARTLSRFLPKSKYQVEATVGHVRDLPKSKLGVDVNNDFEPEWEIAKGKREVLKKIKDAGLKAERIFLATDPDREGEAISWHVLDVLKETPKFPIDKKEVRRVTFHEITQRAVEEALEHAHEVDVSLVNAQQARRVVDRLVGYTLSPVLWRKVRRGLSAGRVQSVAVRMIVEREREREAFKAVEFWDILCELKKSEKEGNVGVFDPQDDGKNSFLAKLESLNGKKMEIGDAKQADGVLVDLSQASYSVAKITKKETLRQAPPPFTTSTLQQNAGQKLGYSAKRTMSLAQRLYEQGLITYHRTDALNLAKEAIDMARTFIQSEYGDKYLPDQPKIYKTKAKVAQEAHEAIRPTEAKRTPEQSGLEGPELRLYKLIWQRFLGCQMVPAVFDKTTIDIDGSVDDESATQKLVYGLKVEGLVRKFDGWLKVGGKSREDDELPDVAEKQNLGLLQVWGNQRFTDPPARYSEATLIKELERLGIGRPSTYAPTLSTIQDRQYVERIDGRLLPTAVGFATNDFLVKHFPTELDYQFTAKMEEDLDEVANGATSWVKVVKEFYQSFEKTVKKAGDAERAAVPTESTGELCPDCVERKAQVAAGGSLEGFLTTHEKAELEKQAKKKVDGKKKKSKYVDEPTSATDGELVVRVGRFGKFLSCSRFPDCRYMGKYMEKIGMKCPKCYDGDVITKTTKTRRTFWGCSRYPDCDWASWEKPGVAKVEEKAA